MTYKNIKFDESPVMRSLEKLAVKKGLVTPEKLTKTATKKTASLSPGKNFEENLFKLCAGLRSSGMEKQAQEVESKFFIFKQAVHLYDTHGETGEDVINQAHPEGSHQMKNVDGDALVETIIDRQKAIIDMIAKGPKSSLAHKNDNSIAINAMRVILGQVTGPLGTGTTVSSVVAPAAAGTFGKSLISRITGMFGGAGAGAGEVGAGGVAVGAAGLAAAAAGSAIVGGLIGNQIFESEFHQTDLAAATKKLTSEMDGVGSKITNKQAVARENLERSVSAAIDSGKIAMELNSKNPPPEALNALGQYVDDLGNARDAAYSIWSSARAIHDKDEGFFSYIGSYSFLNIQLSADNLLKVIDRATAVARNTLNQIVSHIKQTTQNQQATQSGGTKSAQLMEEYAGVEETISSYIAQINAQRMQNAANMVAWLKGKMLSYVEKEKQEFSTINVANKEVSAGPYLQRLQQVKTLLSSFAKKVGLGA